MRSFFHGFFEGSSHGINPEARRPAHELTPDELLREQLKDPGYLPLRDDILRAFDPDRQPSRSKMELHDAWRAFCNGGFTRVSEALEAKTRNGFRYEILNGEFIGSLSRHLTQGIEKLYRETGRPVTVLEVGAGDGRLTYHLERRLRKRLGNRVKVIAVDNGQDIIKPLVPVENLDQKEALRKYQPQIVISSWMPNDVDFTQDFRNTPSVQEYLLIGEPDSGMCGDGLATWGNHGLGYPENEPPPWVKDGFQREDLDDISQFQICRGDDPWDLGLGESISETVSFRRLPERGNLSRAQSLNTPSSPPPVPAKYRKESVR